MFLRQMLPRNTGNSRRRGILFQASLPAAITGRRLMGIDSDMSELSSGAIAAGNNLTVHNNSAAYARPQGYHHQVLAASAAALPHFSQSCHIGIIRCLYFDSIHQSFHLFGYIDILPAKIHAHWHDPVSAHRTGKTDSNALNIVFLNNLFLHLFFQEGRNIRQNILTPITGIGGNFPLLQKISRSLKQTELTGCPANVNTKSVFFHNQISPFSIFLFSSSISIRTIFDNYR